MPRCLLHYELAGTRNLPGTPLKVALDKPEGVHYLDVLPWCREQGIDPAFIVSIDVTEFEDGRLVSYITRWELMTEQEREQLHVGRNGSKVRVYDGPGPLTHMYVEHHDITSAQLLLDQFAPVAAVRERVDA